MAKVLRKKTTSSYMIWVPNATVIKASPNHDREMAGGESANSQDKGLKNEGFAASLGDVFTLPNGGERYIDAHRVDGACVLLHHERRGKHDRRGLMPVAAHCGGGNNNNGSVCGQQ